MMRCLNTALKEIADAEINNVISLLEEQPKWEIYCKECQDTTDSIYSNIAVTIIEQSRAHCGYSLISLKNYKIGNLKDKVGIQMKSTEARDMMVLHQSSMRKYLLWNYLLQCQNRDFLIEPCCNTIISLFPVLYFIWIPKITIY